MVELVSGYSMVKSYRRCPKQYDYKYRQGIQRKKPAAPLIRGTIIHEMLNARATKGQKASIVLDGYEEKYGLLFREERDLYGEDFIGDIKRVYDGYLREYGSDDNIKWLGSEEEVETDIGNGIIYKGHLDKRLLTKDDGRLWIMDHKTHKNIPSEEQRFNDYQILMYLWSHNREAKKADRVDGIVWDYIRTKPPRVPEVLKKGGLSQAQNIDTDYFTYLKELNKLKLDPKPYEEFLANLKKRAYHKFYQRVFLPSPPKEMIEQVVTDFTQTSQIMHGLEVFPRNMTRDCSWCEYYRLCNAELRGLDHEFVRKSEFEVKVVNEDSAEED